MTRVAAGGLAMLLLLLGGFFLWQGRADPDDLIPGNPPPETVVSTGLPEADARDLRGPAPPVATELTREQRRFGRYDRNRDERITRTEMMSSRTKAFRKLDTDGNNLLTFEEWAVTTSDRFAEADKDGNGWLSPEEFAATRPKRSDSARCRC